MLITILATPVYMLVASVMGACVLRIFRFIHQRIECRP